MSRNSFFVQDLTDVSLFKEGDLFKTDIYEVDNNYEIITDLPGFHKDNIHLSYNNGYITISAKKEEEKINNTNYIHRERFYGEYKRTFYVGSINEENIKAKYNEGTLRITLEKQPEIPSRKQISID